MRKLAQLVGLVTVAVIAFELTIRIEDLVRFGMPLWTPVRGPADLMVHDETGVHGRPNVQWRKWRMNNVGTRGPDVRVDPPPGVTRIAIVGASETFGLYESPGLEYPRQLEDSLRATASCARGAGLEVINAAIPGMSLPTYTQDLSLRLSTLSPDIVVVYPSPVQYLDIGVPRAPRPDSTRSDRLLPSWAGHPRSLEQARDGLKSMLPEPVATWLRARDIALARRRLKIEPLDVIPPPRLAAFERDLRQLVGAIRAIGAVPVLVTHANRFTPNTGPDERLLTMWGRFYPLSSGEMLPAFDSAGAVAIATVARDSATVFLDFAGSLPAERSHLFADYVHFTNEGAGRFAGQLAATIRPILGCLR